MVTDEELVIFYLAIALPITVVIWVRTWDHNRGLTFDLQRLFVTALLTAGHFSNLGAHVYIGWVLFGNKTSKLIGLATILSFFLFYSAWFFLWKALFRAMRCSPRART